MEEEGAVGVFTGWSESSFGKLVAGSFKIKWADQAHKFESNFLHRELS